MIQIFERYGSKESEGKAQPTSVETNVKWNAEWNGVKWNGMKVDTQNVRPCQMFTFYLCFVCNVLVTHNHLSDW